jgi:hypothetical protein
MPGYCAVEISIGDAASDLCDDEIASHVRALLEQARQG